MAESAAVVTNLKDAALALNQGDWPTAMAYYHQRYQHQRGSQWQPGLTYSPYTPVEVPRHKLGFDLAQLDYLLANKLLPLEPFGEVLNQWRALAETRSPHIASEALGPYWERPLYSDFTLSLNGRSPFRPDIDWEQVAADFQRRSLGFAMIDQVLAPETLLHIQQHLWRSTCWHDWRRGNYVGSYMVDGLHAPIFFEVAAALKQHLAPLLGSYPHASHWAYKYAPEGGGVGLHADEYGCINVNLWLTPDVANLEAASGGGGLHIHEVLAPLDWNPVAYQDRLHELVPAGGWKQYTIPYRCNRMLIFNSRLLHQTAPYRFDPRYLGYRTNLTFLFGYQGVPLERQALTYLYTDT
jgi:hypothetical protein